MHFHLFTKDGKHRHRGQGIWLPYNQLGVRAQSSRSEGREGGSLFQLLPCGYKGRKGVEGGLGLGEQRLPNAQLISLLILHRACSA